MLRERGYLKEIKIGWLHTDFFKGYFPRISKRIDKTFLGHYKLEKIWNFSCCLDSKTETTGIPVNITKTSVNEIIKKYKLDTALPTVLIISGKEGVGDYVKLVENIIKICNFSMQIITVCGKNKTQQLKLKEYNKNLSKKIKLKVLGLVPHNDLMGLMSFSSVLITKAGGVTPIEAINICIPIILLNIIAGREKKNALFLKRLGVVKLVDNIEDVGKYVKLVLNSNEEKEKLYKAQEEFRKNFNEEKIVDFLLDEKKESLSVDFGAEYGKPARNTYKVLSKLDNLFPVDIEILLSYSTSIVPQRIIWENPFGHIAIRINKMVYSANYIANSKIDHNFLQHISLSEYLYGIVPLSPSQIHTNTYGMAYGRETIGLRIKGIPQEKIELMLKEVFKIENEFKSGKLKWDKIKFNCADAVERILAAGGYGKYNPRKIKIPAMPLDSFEKAKKIFENDKSLKTVLINYYKITGSNALYRYSRFPLSLKQPIRSIGYILSDYSKNKLEKSVNYYVKNYFDEDKIDIERLRKIKFSKESVNLINYKFLTKKFRYKIELPKLDLLKINMLNFIKRG
jgi:UDP-N-acetylglucosamine:LPS N-acetylglucosamine transferase